MIKEQLENTDLKLSEMLLGTMYFGSKVKKDLSFRLMDIYLESGGNFLDSANKYASWVPGFTGGESEKLIGEWLKKNGKREKVIITSKVGFPYGEIPRSLKKEIIISECEKSLKRLKTDCIDIYFAHSFDSDTPLEESMEAFHHLKKSGKIRYTGASNFMSWQLDKANMESGRRDWEGFCCLQQRHTYLEPSLRADFGNQLLLTGEITEYCRQNNMGLMAYSPLLGGVYGRKDREIPPQYRSLDTEQKLRVLGKLASEKDVSPNQLVLSWMLHSSPKINPVISGSSEEQIRENLDATNIRLSDEDMELMNKPVIEPEVYGKT